MDPGGKWRLAPAYDLILGIILRCSAKKIRSVSAKKKPGPISGISIRRGMGRLCIHVNPLTVIVGLSGPFENFSQTIRAIYRAEAEARAVAAVFASRQSRSVFEAKSAMNPWEGQLVKLKLWSVVGLQYQESCNGRE
jgi:hypothetical protein